MEGIAGGADGRRRWADPPDQKPVHVRARIFMDENDEVVSSPK